MDPILFVFEKEYIKQQIDWRVNWTSGGSQLNVFANDEKGFYLKKEMGKGEVYRFRTQYGYSRSEGKELFQAISSFFKEKGSDILLEHDGKLFSTGEKSEKTISLFSDLKRLSPSFITNHLGCFSYDPMPFVSYKSDHSSGQAREGS